MECRVQFVALQTLGLADDREFQEFLDEMSQCAPQTLLKDVIEYIRRRVQPMDEYHMTTGCYLVSPACARHHFLSYKEAIPQARIDLWNMLTRGLIEYERILKGKQINFGTILEQFRKYLIKFIESWMQIG